VLLAEDYDLLLTGSVAEAFEMLARTEVGRGVLRPAHAEMSGTEFFGKVRRMYPDAVRILMSAYEDFDAARNHQPWSSLQVLRQAMEK